MCFRRNTVLLLVACLLAMPGSGQTADDFLMEQLVEQYAEDVDVDFDFTELAERFDFYRRYPIDLNRTDGSEFRDLVFVPELFIDNFLNHRRNAGNFISTYELQVIDGIDLGLLRMLEPMTTVNSPRSLEGLTGSRLLAAGEHDLMVRYGRVMQQQLGYRIKDTSRSRYLGSPDRLFLRYRYHFGRDLQVAVNMKKDAGEQFLSGTQRGGFDFYSASIYTRNQGNVQDLVVGDYALQLGQGLAMWSGLGFGKGAMLQNIAKQSTGLRPYTSSNEVLFLRGAATTVRLGNGMAFTPFVSWRKLDGAVQGGADSTSVSGSLGQTGLHRTPYEARNKSALQQWVYGLNLQYKNRWFRLGATAFQTKFDATIMPPPLLRNLYAFSGSSLWNTSVYYNAAIRNMYLFGEAAHNPGGGFAFIQGLMINLHHHLSLVLLHRNYQEDYHSFFNQAVAEGSVATNEKGFFSGVSYQPSRNIEWVLYADFFRFPWLRYRVDAPSHGMDILSRFTYEWYKQGKVSFRYRYRKKQENAAIDRPENRVVDVDRQQLRIDGEYQLNDSWRMRNRLELSHYKKELKSSETGWMVYHDVIYKPMAGKFSGNLRIALFGTPSYDSRIYAYENNVLYAYSYPVYHNRGFRTYANIRYRFGRKTDVWLRYATFVYRGMDEVGSGLNRIQGNRQSDINLQLRVQF